MSASRGYWAVDVGGTKVEIGVGDHAGKLYATRRIPTPDLGKGDAVTDGIAKALVELAREGGDLKPVAVGIGSPGPLDSKAGKLIRPSNLPGWEGLALVDNLSKRLGVPVFLENDATAAALGEWRYGTGQGTQDMVYVTVSTGIGAGLIARGQLVRGVGDNAGELGHVVVEPGGRPCHCGLRGCLETVASGTAIGRSGEERRKESPLLNQASGPVTAEAVFKAAQAGDPVAQEIIAEATDHLGWGLATLVNLMNPERIVVGGGVSANGEALLGPTRQAMKKYAMPDLLAAAEVVLAGLGADTGVMGALAVAVEHSEG